LNDGIKEDELGGHTRKEDKRNVHRILFWKFGETLKTLAYSQIAG
jgi:hypothetical protein